MPNTDPAKSLVLRLALAHGAMTLAAGAMVLAQPLGDWSNFLIGGLITGHGALVGMWIAMGQRNAAWWLLGTAVALQACALGIRAVIPGLRAETCPEVLLIQIVTICPLVLGLRLFDVAITDRPDAVARPADRQFSLGALFMWTVVTAILLSLFQAMPMTVTSSDPVNPLRTTGGLLVVLSANGLLGLGIIWAVLGRGLLPFRALLVAAILLVPPLVPFPYVEPWHRLVFFSAHVMVMIGSLTVLRGAGFRLRRLPRDPASIGLAE